MGNRDHIIVESRPGNSSNSSSKVIIRLRKQKHRDHQSSKYLKRNKQKEVIYHESNKFEKVAHKVRDPCQNIPPPPSYLPPSKVKEKRALRCVNVRKKFKNSINKIFSLLFTRKQQIEGFKSHTEGGEVLRQKTNVREKIKQFEALNPEESKCCSDLKQGKSGTTLFLRPPPPPPRHNRKKMTIKLDSEEKLAPIQLGEEEENERSSELIPNESILSLSVKTCSTSNVGKEKSKIMDAVHPRHKLSKPQHTNNSLLKSINQNQPYKNISRYRTENGNAIETSKVKDCRSHNESVSQIFLSKAFKLPESKSKSSETKIGTDRRTENTEVISQGIRSQNNAYTSCSQNLEMKTTKSIGDEQLTQERIFPFHKFDKRRVEGTNGTCTKTCYEANINSPNGKGSIPKSSLNTSVLGDISASNFKLKSVTKSQGKEISKNKIVREKCKSRRGSSFAKKLKDSANHLSSGICPASVQSQSNKNLFLDAIKAGGSKLKTVNSNVNTKVDSKQNQLTDLTSILARRQLIDKDQRRDSVDSDPDWN